MSRTIENGVESPGRNDAGPLRLLVLAPHELPARWMPALLRRPCRVHYGLFSGFTGALSAGRGAVAFHGEGDMLAYTAVRHLTHLLQPELIVHLAAARAVAESFREGDIALVREAIPCWCPPALTQEMIGDTSLLDAEVRARSGTLGGGVAKSEARAREELLSCVKREGGALAGRIRSACTGSTAEPLHGWFAREFVRRRFGVDVTDHDSHGFLTACGEVAVRGAAIRMVGEKEGAESEPLASGAWEALARVLARLSA